MGKRIAAVLPLSVDSDLPGAVGRGEETHSPIELELLPMWRKLFPGETILSDSDFFELGGDSLLLVMLQSMIGNKFGLRLEAVDISEHFTVRKLAQWVDEKLARGV